MNELEHILSKRYDQEILLKLFQKYFVNWIADGYIGKELNIFEISTIGEKTDKEVLLKPLDAPSVKKILNKEKAKLLGRKYYKHQLNKNT